MRSNNVTPLKRGHTAKAEDPEIDEDEVVIRRDAATRAIYAVRTLMEGQRKLERKAAARLMDDACVAYREKPSGRDTKVKAMSAIDAQVTVAQRAERIAAFDEAIRELMTKRVDPNQSDLFGTGGVAGLGWVSDGTRDSAYAALLFLDRGSALDEYQRELLTDLGNAGIKEVDLGMNAAEAVEHDADEEEVSEGDGDDVFPT